MRTVRRGWGIGLTGVAALLLIGVFVTYGPMVGLRAKSSPKNRAVALIRAGKLKPDGRGVAALPAELARASVDGSAYVTNLQEGVTVVFFPTWRGKGTNVEGYLYAPEFRRVTRSFDDDNNAMMDIVTPAVRDGMPTSTVVIEREIDNNWAFVGYHQD